MTMQQPPQNGQIKNPGSVPPAQKSAQGAKPVYPDTTKTDKKGDKKSGGDCGC